MNARSDAGRIAVWGSSGSGKSTYVQRRIANARRVVVFDPMAEYEKCDRARRLDDIRLLMEANWTAFRIAYRPPVGKEAEALSKVCFGLLKAQEPFLAGQSKRRLTLVVEELNLSFPVHGGATKCPGFAEICSRGRHSGITVIGISQRAKEVSKRFRGNCTEAVTFMQFDEGDAKAAAESVRCRFNQIPSEPLHYIRRSGAKVTTGKLLFSGKNPERTKKRRS